MMKCAFPVPFSLAAVPPAGSYGLMQFHRLWLAPVCLFLSLLSAHAQLPQRWVYCPSNLLVDKNVDELGTLFQRASQAGYNGILLADSKFAKLGELDPRYFRNLDRVKKLAAENHLEIVPAVFPIGYSNDILWHDPNLAEALPVRDALFVVRGGVARPEADPPVAFKNGDFSDLKRWSWKDENVIADNGAAKISNPNGSNARIVQKFKVSPFRQYHVAVRIKTQDFRGQPEAKVIGTKGRTLNYANLGTKPTQDWTVHHVVFNSLDDTEVNVYFGTWGGKTGTLWFDDAKIEETGLVNLVRRDGAPLTVKREGGNELVEGRDFERVADPLMGSQPWKGEYTVWHEPPVIKTSLPAGTRLRVSYYHTVTVYEGQVNICPSEPKTLELLRDEAKRMHAAWGAQGYMMSHDEIRVLNWCEACQKRHLDAGALLADNVRACIKILREVNPGGKIYVWNDMFDPYHNAHNNYYLVRGDLTGSWEGLDKDVIILNWNFGKRDQSLKWFADRGNRQIIAGYYDANPEQGRTWLESAHKVNGVTGMMYTTWQHKYSELERFGQIIQGK